MLYSLSSILRDRQRVLFFAVRKDGFFISKEVFFMSKFTNHPSWLSARNSLPMAETERCFRVCEDGGDRLNEEQSSAVSSLTGYHLIHAGAGTGKTACLVARFQRLQQTYPDARQCLISFSKKSAEELRSRIGAAQNLTVSTFHSLSYHILKSSGWKFKVSLSDAAQEGIIRKLIGKEYVTIEDVLTSLHREPKEDPVRKIRQRYFDYLKEHHTVTFATMQPLALEALDRNPSLLRWWQDRYDFYQVDEFQDLDSQQLRLLSSLTEKCRNLAVVGDQRQAIYSFRGSVPQIMEAFAASAKCYDLTVNYRCNPAILGLANRIMPEYKPLVAAERDEEQCFPQYLVARNAMEEAKRVADEIQKLHRQGIPFRDMAILYRSSTASSHMLDELLERGIPVVCKSQSSSRFAMPPYGDIIRMFSCAMDLSDKEAFRKVLPILYLSGTQGKKAWNTAQRKKIPWTEAMCQLPLPFFQIDYLEGMAKAIKSAAGLAPAEALRRLLRGGYGKYVGKSMLPAMDSVLEELEDYPTIPAFLGHVAELKEKMDAMRSAELQTDDFVQMMTIHTSKGMEFHSVFLIGCFDGCLPSGREGADMEEERRLLYVAVTRAKERLYISYPRLSDGKAEPNELSRFLREAFSV